MPRTRRENRPVSEHLAEVKENLDELLELVTEWERGQGDERQLQNLARAILGLLLVVRRDLLETAMRFRSLEQNRVMALEIEKRAPRTTAEV